MKKIILLILIVIANLSCSNKLKEGEVVEMWYEPETTDVVYMTNYISNGNSYTVVMTPYFVTDSEYWCIKIKGKHEGEEITETFYVTKKQYECLSIGSDFKINKDCSITDENNISKEIKK